MEVYTNFAELGCGSVDFKSVINIIDEAGFKGHYCIELDRAPISNKQSAINNFKFVSAL